MKTLVHIFFDKCIFHQEGESIFIEEAAQALLEKTEDGWTVHLLRKAGTHNFNLSRKFYGKLESGALQEAAQALKEVYHARQLTLHSWARVLGWKCAVDLGIEDAQHCTELINVIKDAPDKKLTALNAWHTGYREGIVSIHGKSIYKVVKHI